MGNPWEEVRFSDYEAHMSLPGVGQLQLLNRIMKEQFYQHPVKTLAVLGIGGGNGLEHIDSDRIDTVYGIDVNQEYLNVCGERFSNLQNHLVLMRLDLSDLKQCVPPVDLIVANLFIEYIGAEAFVWHIRRSNPAYISCVIQKNEDKSFVSDSPYTEAFSNISALHRDIASDDLKDRVEEAGYRLSALTRYPLPNGKAFLRLDFSRCMQMP